jgi:carbon-monoxide dehydrogenase medium subunit
VLADAAAGIGDPQVRHRGTIGGSIAHADPASDLPTVLVALEADLVARGGSGERVIPAADFFRGVFESALEPTELLTEIRVPAASGAYVKFHRRQQDWATVGVAAVRVGDGARVALTNMGATPLRARGVEEALASGADAEAAAARADEGTDPPSDTNASADFRRHLAQVLVRDALAALQ